MAGLLRAIILFGVATLTAGITTDDGSGAKRTADYSSLIGSARTQSRRIQAGTVTGNGISVNHFHPSRRARPPLATPPYAVQMEPLVQYSQRDPLYHQRQEQANLTKDNSIGDDKVHRIDHDPEGTNVAETYNYDTNYHQHYYREPEPIIEIIIKESNESLPTAPAPPIQPAKPSKEPVHVFYVKYKKNPKGKGEDDIIYEAPIPAITPPTNNDEIEHDSSPQVSDTAYETATASPPQSTTLRTVIHPDSEIYHGSGLKVTFGETEIKSADATFEESNSPSPSIALPQKEAQSRQSNAEVNSHTPIKRQGTYQTIPQEVYDQNPPKVPVSSAIPTFQTPVGRFQQNGFPQQNAQSLHYHQTQQSKVTFPRQVPAQQQPAFRPQHTGNLLNNAQTTNQNQFNQRPYNYQHQQFQTQASTFQQRQVPRQQNNIYSTLQSPTQNPQQTPQFRGTHPQYEQRPVQYSQPLNNPQQFQRQQPPTTQLIQQQNVAQLQQEQQHRQQQQIVQSQIRSQPINVPNQELNRLNHQPSQAPQPSNTPIPLPSKPIHPLYAHHYHQQISLAQQQRQNFIPSTHQPQQQLRFQQLQQIQLQQPQQQYKTHQPTINIPRQPSTSQPLQSYELTSPSPKVTNDAFHHDGRHSVSHFPDGQIIKSISQSEEHQLQPQFNQPSLGQNIQQKTAEHVNQQTQQLRSQQQFNQQSANQHQSNQQVLNQQQINQQYRQQIQLQQQNQQSLTNSDLSNHPFTLKQNQQRHSEYVHPNLLVSTTSQPVKSTTVAIQTKYNQLYSKSTPTTPTATEETPIPTTEDPKAKAEKEKKFKENLAALPDEVPEDIREQLLSSGILSNADISILDYDKVGDIPIESLPPEALENFYGAGSAPVPAIVAPDSAPAESKNVEMKVVRYDPSTQEGQKVEDTYIKDDATQVDSVILNDSKYNRYLPLKVSGVNFPLPDASILAGKRVNSVVVLAPVDYDFVKEAEEEEERAGRSAPVQVQGVRFIAGNILKSLIKNPTEENYKNWLAKEKSHPADRQSVVLLVVSPDGSEKGKEIFMYDINSEKLSRLKGELSSTFVEVAESNASSQELDGLADVEGAASERHAVRLTASTQASPTADLATAGTLHAHAHAHQSQAPTISSGYSKMAVQ